MGCDDSWCIVPECLDRFMHRGDHTFWVDGERKKMSTIEYRKLPDDRTGRPTKADHWAASLGL
jgi:hypothetical protein